MNEAETGRYIKKLEKALAQVVYDCDDVVDWDAIAEQNGDLETLRACIDEKGYTAGIIEYYKRMSYVFEGSSK